MKAIPTTSEFAELHKAMSEVLKASMGAKPRGLNTAQQKKSTQPLPRPIAKPTLRKP